MINLAIIKLLNRIKGKLVRSLVRLFVADWDYFVKSAVQLWEELYLNWLFNQTGLLVVYYEDLKNTSLRNAILQDITKFLGLNLDNARLKCVLQNPYTKFKRHKRGCLEDKGLVADKTEALVCSDNVAAWCCK